jgi:hypothetical protein
MIGFIAPYKVKIPDKQYSAIADLHTLYFTVTHALGFPGFPIRNLAMDI